MVHNRRLPMTGAMLIALLSLCSASLQAQNQHPLASSVTSGSAANNLGKAISRSLIDGYPSNANEGESYEEYMIRQFQTDTAQRQAYRDRHDKWYGCGANGSHTCFVCRERAITGAQNDGRSEAHVWGPCNNRTYYILNPRSPGFIGPMPPAVYQTTKPTKAQRNVYTHGPKLAPPTRGPFATPPAPTKPATPAATGSKPAGGTFPTTGGPSGPVAPPQGGTPTPAPGPSGPTTPGPSGPTTPGPSGPTTPEPSGPSTPAAPTGPAGPANPYEHIPDAVFEEVINDDWYPAHRPGMTAEDWALELEYQWALRCLERAQLDGEIDPQECTRRRGILFEQWIIDNRRLHSNIAPSKTGLVTQIMPAPEEE